MSDDDPNKILENFSGKKSEKESSFKKKQSFGFGSKVSALVFSCMFGLYGLYTYYGSPFIHMPIETIIPELLVGSKPLNQKDAANQGASEDYSFHLKTISLEKEPSEKLSLKKTPLKKSLLKNHEFSQSDTKKSEENQSQDIKDLLSEIKQLNEKVDGLSDAIKDITNIPSHSVSKYSSSKQGVNSSPLMQKYFMLKKAWDAQKPLQKYLVDIKKEVMESADSSLKRYYNKLLFLEEMPDISREMLEKEGEALEKCCTNLSLGSLEKWVSPILKHITFINHKKSLIPLWQAVDQKHFDQALERAKDIKTEDFRKKVKRYIVSIAFLTHLESFLINLQSIESDYPAIHTDKNGAKIHGFSPPDHGPKPNEREGETS